MEISLDTVKKFVDLDDPGDEAIVDAINPFLPVINRLGKDAIDSFTTNVFENGGDFTAVTTELYEQLTEDERDVLSAAVLQDAQAAVRQRFQEKKEFQAKLFKIAMSVALTALA
jgi:hypothetical protein